MNETRQESYLTEYDLPLDQEAIKRSLANHIEYTQGKDEFSATPLDFFWATARATRDRMMDRWNKTQRRYYEENRKRVYYLSLEFLLGRLLRDGLTNLGIAEAMAGALGELGCNLEELCEAEEDAGLGNGGLGRLAACFLDSMATLGLAGMGYGIRYEYGIFRQDLIDGAQVERADTWLRYGSPWEVPRPERLYEVQFGGRVITFTDPSGQRHHDWVDGEHLYAMAHDVLVPGYHNGVVNTLRLWSAKAAREFDFGYFNRGDYIEAIQNKTASENISRVLYPNDMVLQGRELRLKQEYFFVAATLQDAFRRHLKNHDSLASLPDHAVFQLNDTHPGIAVAELMRLLVDVHHFGWDEAWRITRGSIAYTNHTVLPEALERWPVSLLGRLLPRHLQIIYEINQHHLDGLRARHYGDDALYRRLSVIEEGSDKQVRMANLCMVGSRAVNGVSKLHTRILREKLFRDFAELEPSKLSAKTNGVTPRRWLLECNPQLAKLISSRIGEAWVTDLPRLEALAPLAEDEAFRGEWRRVKLANKQRLAEYLQAQHGFELDPSSLFDVHVKRLHEYKRQLLNILHVVALYLERRARPDALAVKRTFLFGGKAAPGYFAAKQVLRLISAVGEVINGDPAVNQRLRVYFIPNYSVSLAERVIPAADVSEQISTAGFEASGTGNMKLALNGALTVGTLDGANVEIAEAVGTENLFLFGLDATEVEATMLHGYAPRDLYAGDAELRAVLDAVAGGMFSRDDPARFRGLVEGLLNHDPFLVLADFRSYRSCHQSVAEAWKEPEGWTRRSIATVARMGRFSSDETIAAYARDIWGVGLGSR